MQCCCESDIYAASRIVATDPDDGTDTNIASALANVPAGGTIFVKDPLLVTDTLVFPRAPVSVEFASGAEVTTTGLGAKPLLLFPDGLAGITRYSIINLKTLGEDLATAQYLAEIADANSFAMTEFFLCDVRLFRRIFNVSNGDVTFAHATIIQVSNSFILPPNAASKLVTTPNPHASGVWGTSAKFTNCRLEEDADLSIGWADDVDGDIILVNSVITLVGAAFNGLTSDPASFIVVQGTVEFTGSSYDSTDEVHGTIASTGTLKVSSNSARLDITLTFGASLVLNAIGILVRVKQVTGHSAVAVAVDILSGANYCTVEGWFLDNTTACIRTAATHGSFKGGFNSTAAHKTILELAGADFNISAGSTGLHTGGSVTVVGASSLYDVTLANVA